MVTLQTVDARKQQRAANGTRKRQGKEGKQTSTATKHAMQIDVIRLVPTQQQCDEHIKPVYAFELSRHRVQGGQKSPVDFSSAAKKKNRSANDNGQAVAAKENEAIISYITYRLQRNKSATEYRQKFHKAVANQFSWVLVLETASVFT